MRVTILIALLLTPTVCAWANVQDTTQVRLAEDAPRVTYISGSSVYVSAGADHGLYEGAELRVSRDDVLVGVMRVVALSSNRAVCSVVDGRTLPSVGDLVQVSRAPEESAGSGSSPRVLSFARISHVDQDTVFIDSGEDVGLQGGDRLEVMREGITVANLEVTDVGLDRSGCTVVGGKASLETGDVIRLPFRESAAGSGGHLRSGTETIIVVPSDAKSRTPSSAQVRGRVGVRYLFVRDRETETGDLSQPALDLRLDGHDLGHEHLDLAIDVRSRRTYRSGLGQSTGTTDQTRVYRLSGTIHDTSSRYRLTVGRQFSPSLASVSTFDGLLLDYSGNRWSTGVFGGSQPAIEDYGYSTDIKEYGVFVQAHNRRGRTHPWSVTLGALGSYHFGEVNREFVYVQSLYSGPRLTFYATEEIDYNRDWKIEAGEEQISLTSSYAHLSWRVAGGFSMRGGYDNRRNIRLYRDHITPEVEFDDQFRRGAWVGFTQRVKKRFRFGIDAKNSRTSTSGDADTYTLTLGLSGVTRANLSTYYRGTHYSNMTVEGQIHSLNSSVSVTRNVRLILSGGIREDTNLLDPLLTNELVWYGAELDLNMGRHWFLMLSSDRNEGDTEDNHQSYLSVMYRF